MRKRQPFFASIFRKLVPDLSEPDGDGWALGLCPYCHSPGSFHANLRTGAWVCMPVPKPASPQGQTDSGIRRGPIPSISNGEGA